jgi:hypothetical protein
MKKIKKHTIAYKEFKNTQFIQRDFENTQRKRGKKQTALHRVKEAGLTEAAAHVGTAEHGLRTGLFNFH